MSGVSSLQMVLELTKRQKNEAAERVANLQSELFDAQEQLRQLETYTTKTGLHLISTSPTTHEDSVQTHRHYQSMLRLQHAIDLQNEVIDNITQQLAEETEQIKQFSEHLIRLETLIIQRQTNAAPHAVSPEDTSSGA